MHHPASLRLHVMVKASKQATQSRQHTIWSAMHTHTSCVMHMQAVPLAAQP